MSGNVQPYLDLITSEHASKPNFIASVTVSIQPFADALALLNTFPTLWDIDTAVGAQLDTVGQWIGQSRYLEIPLVGVYFAWDTAGLGWDQGYWQGPFDPSSGVVALNDTDYRTLLLAKIANNVWDGTIPSAYEFLAPVFPNNLLIIQDKHDMGMYIGILGPALDAVTTSLLENGYLDVKPAGVRIDGYVTQSVAGKPLFGFDAENSTISGWDVGAWATITGGK